MLTIREWFKYNDTFKENYEALESMPFQCTINTLTLIDIIADMCGLKNTRAGVLRAATQRLKRDAIVEELNLEPEEAKVHEDRKIRNKYKEINYRYRNKVPAQIFYEANKYEWFHNELRNIYNTIISKIDEPCKVGIFTSYKEIYAYCDIAKQLYNSDIEIKIKETESRLKEQGYNRLQIIAKLADILAEN